MGEELGETMDWVEDPDLGDPSPDVWVLFRHYDALYFRGAVTGAGFSLHWSSPRRSMISSFGSCTFGKSGNTIMLYEPLLKYRSNADLKNALLHLMIHAILHVKHDSKNICNHGPIFRAWMDAINSCSFEDHQRPRGGYCITTNHSFGLEESCSIQGFLWKCASCGDTLARAMRMGPPSDSCCIENVNNDATCGNKLCHWHNHKIKCGGMHARMVSKPGQKKVLKGTQMLLTGTCKMSKSQRTVQESESSELQKNATVTKPNAEGKLLSLMGSTNTKSLGSSSLKKARKRHRSEDFQKAIVLPAAPLRKPKLEQDFIASEKHKLFSPAAPQKKLKLQKPLVASEKHGIFSLGGYSNAKPQGSSTSDKVGKLHKPEGVQKACVPPAAAPRKLKRDLVASAGESELFSLVGCSSAKVLGSISSKKVHKQCEHEDTQKTIALPVAPQSKLKQLTEINSSTSIKAGKQHMPEGIRKTTVLPAARQSRSKLKQSNLVASEKQKTKHKTKKSAEEKEFAVISAWLHYYESECSSGSTEPLVNKRTERRKKAINRSKQIAYARSRKQSASGISSIITHSLEEDSSQQSKPPSPRLDIGLIAPADRVVTQQALGDQSQLPAPCLDLVAAAIDQVVPFQSADPPGLTPSNQRSSLDAIDISDDD